MTMISVVKEMTFDAAHLLRNYIGACANLHGHTYRVQVELCGAEEALQNGMLVDFKVLKAAMQEVIGRYDHTFLNNEPPFDTINPTAENMAIFFLRSLQDYEGLQKQYISCVRIWETPTSYAEACA
jgi:6-pyruvoyltetrahydropterin/6-carboxytetrahydropterin synthase